MGRCAYFYDPDVGNFYYAQGHPMKPHRMRMTHNLLVAYGMVDKLDVLTPPRATERDMTRFHADEYISFLKLVTPDSAAEHHQALSRFNVLEDCPVFDGLWEYCQIAAGGSLGGAARLNSGESSVALNWAGGLHHAKKAEASGFCYINDCVLAILELLKVHSRVLYVDIDIHHGDGVEEAFYSTDRVMTASFHKFGGFFPGTGAVDDIGSGRGKNYAVNFPLRDGIDDESYREIFTPVMTRVMQWYAPGAVVLQCGADSLSGDRLGCFNLSLRGHAQCVDFFKSYDVPLLVLGGGGYTIRNVARCWAFETSRVLGVDLADSLPFNDNLEFYAPEFRLHIVPSNMENHNTMAELEANKAQILEHLRGLPAAPSIPLIDVPRASPLGVHSNDIDSDGDDPDTRRSIRRSKSIVEYEDSDDDLGDDELLGNLPSARRRIRRSGGFASGLRKKIRSTHVVRSRDTYSPPRVEKHEDFAVSVSQPSITESGLRHRPTSVLVDPGLPRYFPDPRDLHSRVDISATASSNPYVGQPQLTKSLALRGQVENAENIVDVPPSLQQPYMTDTNLDNGAVNGIVLSRSTESLKPYQAQSRGRHKRFSAKDSEFSKNPSAVPLSANTEFVMDSGNEDRDSCMRPTLKSTVIEEVRSQSDLQPDATMNNQTRGTGSFTSDIHEHSDKERGLSQTVQQQCREEPEISERTDDDIANNVNPTADVIDSRSKYSEHSPGEVIRPSTTENMDTKEKRAKNLSSLESVPLQSSFVTGGRHQKSPVPVGPGNRNVVDKRSIASLDPRHISAHSEEKIVSTEEPRYHEASVNNIPGDISRIGKSRGRYMLDTGMEGLSIANDEEEPGKGKPQIGAVESERHFRESPGSPYRSDKNPVTAPVPLSEQLDENHNLTNDDNIEACIASPGFVAGNEPKSIALEISNTMQHSTAEAQRRNDNDIEAHPSSFKKSAESAKKAVYGNVPDEQPGHRTKVSLHPSLEKMEKDQRDEMHEQGNISKSHLSRSTKRSLGLPAGKEPSLLPHKATVVSREVADSPMRREHGDHGSTGASRVRSDVHDVEPRHDRGLLKRRKLNEELGEEKSISSECQGLPDYEATIDGSKNNSSSSAINHDTEFPNTGETPGARLRLPSSGGDVGLLSSSQNGEKVLTDSAARLDSVLRQDYSVERRNDRSAGTEKLRDRQYDDKGVTRPTNQRDDHAQDRLEQRIVGKVTIKLPASGKPSVSKAGGSTILEATRPVDHE